MGEQGIVKSEDRSLYPRYGQSRGDRTKGRFSPSLMRGYLTITKDPEGGPPSFTISVFRDTTNRTVRDVLLTS